MNLGHLLFGFEGRINRLPYWLSGIALGAVMAIAIGVLYSTVPVSPWVTVLPTLLVLWPLTATSVKRAHDRNRTPWILAPTFVAEFVLIVLAFTGSEPIKIGDSSSAAMPEGAALFIFVLAVLNFAYQLYLLVELGFLRGTIGPNRYGPDPLAEPISTPVQG